MINIALAVGFLTLMIALILNLWRLMHGPSIMDRVLAADTMVINTIALIILFGIYQQTTAYFESALLFAMFGFTSTVGYCRFLLRGDIIE
jgi:multicomponent K+:H+ antiporter subunit F